MTADEVLAARRRDEMDYAAREAGTAELAAESGEARLATARVAELAGTSYRSIDHWVRLGHLRPEGGNGAGDPRRWPEAEVEIAVRMGRLAAAGLPLEWAASFARDGVSARELAPGIRVEVTP
jgi:hypothetical protein